MSRPIIKIHNTETDQIETREMNDTEFASYQAQMAELAKEKEIEAIRATQRQALLNKLGITQEEAKLLLS